jgi:hypothetical protein
VALLKVDPRYSTLVHLGALAAMLIAGYDRSVTLWTGGTAMGLPNAGRKSAQSSGIGGGVTSEKGRVPVAWGRNGTSWRGWGLRP